VRAERRVKELRERGLEAIYARVLQDLNERDARDRARAVAPLTPATDALVLDTSTLDADAVFDVALRHIAARRQG
jgi:cytidylate kinase